MRVRHARNADNSSTALGNGTDMTAFMVLAVVTLIIIAVLLATIAVILAVMADNSKKDDK